MTMTIHIESRPNAIGKLCSITIEWDKHFPKTLSWIVSNVSGTWSTRRDGFTKKGNALRSARQFVDTLAQ